MIIKVRITGFGGQGVITAGYILGKAASIYDNKHSTFTQSYGPEARGGASRERRWLSDGRRHPRLQRLLPHGPCALLPFPRATARTVARAARAIVAGGRTDLQRLPRRAALPAQRLVGLQLRREPRARVLATVARAAGLQDRGLALGQAVGNDQEDHR